MSYTARFQWFSLLAAALISLPASAEENTTRSVRSIDYSKADTPELSLRDQQFKQVDTLTLQQPTKEMSRLESTSISVEITSVEYSIIPNFNLYDAASELIHDIDGDGFYHRFAITIDADTLYDSAYVYAKLFISYEGGPWEYFSTSEIYNIHGDSIHDSFIMETELADGFAPGHYDIRIELYDELGHWLLSYGPYDDDSLSGLPLEDSYHDTPLPAVHIPVEAEVVVSAHGSMHGLWLLFIPAMLLTRRLAKRK